MTHNRKARSTRQEAAARRRDAVMNSPEFRDWWGQRRHVDPVPSSPYQAYMIDLSLSAKLEDRSKWERGPNRNDQLKIDFPFAGAPNYGRPRRPYQPDNAPAHKPRDRTEQPERSPELPREGLSRELQLAADAMAVRYGIPAPQVEIKSGGANRSYARVGVGGWGDKLIRAGGGVVTIFAHEAGKKGRKAKPIELGTLYHEVGHVVHAQASVLPEGERPKNMTSLYKVSPLNYTNEHFATLFAKEEIHRTLSKGPLEIKKATGESRTIVREGKVKNVPIDYNVNLSMSPRAMAKWDLRWALSTYQKGWKARGKPVKINSDGTISGGSY